MNMSLENIRNNCFLSLIIMVVTILMGLGISYIIKKYIPFLLGGKYEKN